MIVVTAVGGKWAVTERTNAKRTFHETCKKSYLEIRHFKELPLEVLRGTAPLPFPENKIGGVHTDDELKSAPS
jgi:hypothetical protein